MHPKNSWGGEYRSSFTTTILDAARKGCVKCEKPMQLGLRSIFAFERGTGMGAGGGWRDAHALYSIQIPVEPWRSTM
jgi:hypothetical protein